MTGGRLMITVGSVALTVSLKDTPSARAVRDAAPFESTAATWGEEVYFRAPVLVDREPDAREVVTPGEIAFWTDGTAIAIGYGKTPISRGGETRLASPCNIFGVTDDDVGELKAVRDGDTVTVEPSD